jgi:hypothetical protein
MSESLRANIAFAMVRARCYTPGDSRQGGGAVFGPFPKCQKCKSGDLVPLSDFGSQGAAIHFKAWACTNPDCGFNIKIRNGDLYIDEPIASGALHSPRLR